MADFTVKADWSALVPHADISAHVRFQQHGDTDKVPGDVRAEIVNGVLRSDTGEVGVTLPAANPGESRLYWATFPNVRVNGASVEPVRFLFAAPEAGELNLSTLYPGLAFVIAAAATPGGATEQYVDDAAAGALADAKGYTDTAVSGLASQQDVSNAVAGLASQQYVDDAIAAAIANLP